MRIDLSRPLPGLLMALPLIAILMSVHRTPIAVTQPLSRAKEAMIETTGTAAVMCAPNIDKAARWPSDWTIAAATAGLPLPS